MAVCLIGMFAGFRMAGEIGVAAVGGVGVRLLVSINARAARSK